LLEMKVPARRMSSVPVAIRGRSVVIVRYSGTFSQRQRVEGATAAVPP
jgi:hypothetical protein